MLFFVPYIVHVSLISLPRPNKIGLEEKGEHSPAHSPPWRSAHYVTDDYRLISPGDLKCTCRGPVCDGNCHDEGLSGRIRRLSPTQPERCHRLTYELLSSKLRWGSDSNLLFGSLHLLLLQNQPIQQQGKALKEIIFLSTVRHSTLGQRSESDSASEVYIFQNGLT